MIASFLGGPMHGRLEQVGPKIGEDASPLIRHVATDGEPLMPNRPRMGMAAVVEYRRVWMGRLPGGEHAAVYVAEGD